MNVRISVTTAEDLVAAGRLAGYNVQIEESPGRGYHHTVVVPHPLPEDLAQALSAVFKQMPNPARLLDGG